MNSFFKYIQKAQIWLNELTKIGQFKDERQALSVLRLVLHGLRDRITLEQNAHFAAELPTLIRGIYYSGWDPHQLPTDEKTMDEFIHKLQPGLSKLDVDSENSVKSVIKLLTIKMDEGELNHLCDTLPKDMKPFFKKQS